MYRQVTVAELEQARLDQIEIERARATCATQVELAIKTDTERFQSQRHERTRDTERRGDDEVQN